MLLPGIMFNMLASLAMLIYVTSEMQWETKLINQLHILNESVFYLLCVSLICFSGLLLEPNQAVALGWYLIAIITMMIIWNSIIILYEALAFTRQLLLRHRSKFSTKMARLIEQKLSFSMEKQCKSS